MQPVQPEIILATDDARLQSKAERLFAKSNLTVRNATTANFIVNLLHTYGKGSQHYVFIDLDAKGFNGYELARDIKEAVAHVRIIGASFAVEPSVIQKTKLYGIDMLLQRFAMEKLLKTLAEGSPKAMEEINGATD